MYGHFPGTKRTVRIREVYVRRGSTVVSKTFYKSETFSIIENLQEPTAKAKTLSLNA